MSWMLSSPRTTNYLTKYFAEIHPQYPFLNRADFLEPCNAPANPHATPFTHAIDQSNPTQTYTRLVTAAIGALLHHQSRDISARYFRHAMSISIDSSLESTMWSSISGIHAAMLLAIYCLLEHTMTFSNEEEDTSHAEINLWLWNCRIAAGCIDLGLHQGRSDERYEHAEEGRGDGGQRRAGDDDGEEDDEDSQLSELYRNTFRSAFVLDGRISEVRHRPRAIHEGDVDGRLIVDLI
jgi:Fungal specific transcription factor domain